jgi:hypothetical protein
VKKTNELGNFEGVRRVKEQKKKSRNQQRNRGEERRGEEEPPAAVRIATTIASTIPLSHPR